MMRYIETAVKNIALESILINANSENIQDMYDKAVSGYNSAAASLYADKRKKLQQNKLNLQKNIQSNLAYTYREENPKITYFYHTVRHSTVPIGHFSVIDVYYKY